MQREAELRLKLESLVQLNERYKTLFDSLKLNTAHNSAILEPFLFMLRRMIYSALIIFMPHLPQIATSLLLIACLVIMAFTLIEKPWSTPEMNKLAVINEALLYTVLILILASPSFTTVAERHVLGWAMIGVVTLVIHVNFCAILAQAWHHCKLLYTRY